MFTSMLFSASVFLKRGRDFFLKETVLFFDSIDFKIEAAVKHVEQFCRDFVFLYCKTHQKSTQTDQKQAGISVNQAFEGRQRLLFNTFLLKYKKDFKKAHLNVIVLFLVHNKPHNRPKICF